MNNPHSLTSLVDLDGNTAEHRHMNIQRWTTPEGARVLFVETHEIPMFEIKLDFAAGSSRDAQAPGLALLTNGMLNEGIAGKNAEQLAIAFEEQGALFSNSINRDFSSVGLRSLSAPQKREAAVALLAQVVGQPALPESAFEQVRGQAINLVKKKQRSPAHQLSVALMRQLYINHPYTHSRYGNEASLATLTLEQVRAFHHASYGAGNLTICLVGDLSRAEAQTTVDSIVAHLPKSPALAPIAPATWLGPEVIHLDAPGTDVTVMLALPAINRADPDHVPLTVANMIFGGGNGFESRLMQELRVKRGLTYGAYSTLTQLLAGGHWTLTWSTQAAFNQATQNLVEQMLRDFLRDGPTADELAQARATLLGRYPLQTASNSQILSQLQTIGTYGLALDAPQQFVDKLQTLTPEHIRAAMNRHFDADQLLYLSTGPDAPQLELPELSIR
jgi:zinc protease